MSERPWMKYWQCPRDESHPIQFFPRWQTRQTRCSICEIPTVLDYSPAQKAEAVELRKGNEPK